MASQTQSYGVFMPIDKLPEKGKRKQRPWPEKVITEFLETTESFVAARYESVDKAKHRQNAMYAYLRKHPEYKTQIKPHIRENVLILERVTA